jgi:hypothetical protein
MIHCFTNKEVVNMDRYSQVLQELIRNAGLQGVSLVSTDGLPIASVLRPGTREDRVAGIGAAILALGERVVEELVRGDLEQVIIKGRDGYVILTGVGNNAVLVALADDESKLGLLLMEIDKTREKLKQNF